MSPICVTDREEEAPGRSASLYVGSGLEYWPACDFSGIAGPVSSGVFGRRSDGLCELKNMSRHSSCAMFVFYAPFSSGVASGAALDFTGHRGDLRL